jgi:hypothetical protein
MGLAVSVRNTEHLNGVKLNGLKLNGLKLNGVKLNGVKLNGVKLNGVKLNGTTLVSAEGTSGADLVGAELDGSLSDGTILPLRIDSVSRGEGDDVLLYSVSYWADGSWQPLCGTDAQGSAYGAVALAGAWDYREGVRGGGSWIDDPQVFTFGCRQSALGKCVIWGYKPWRGFRGHHQACTRAVRADYCGDGRPWTFDGTAINLYDGIGLNVDDQGWTFEAEWDADGARCMYGARIAEGQTYREMAPACMDGRTVGRCAYTRNFARGTLLMSEWHLWWQGWGLMKQNYDYTYALD